jgi:hypothetical protein
MTAYISDICMNDVMVLCPYCKHSHYHNRGDNPTVRYDDESNRLRDISKLIGLRSFAICDASKEYVIDINPKIKQYFLDNIDIINNHLHKTYISLTYCTLKQFIKEVSRIIEKVIITKEKEEQEKMSIKDFMEQTYYLVEQDVFDAEFKAFSRIKRIERNDRYLFVTISEFARKYNEFLISNKDKYIYQKHYRKIDIKNMLENIVGISYYEYVNRIFRHKPTQ